MSLVIDRLLNALKWPTALGALVLLPGSAWALWELSSRFFSERQAHLPFLGGFAAYLLAWHFILKRPVWGSLVSTFEHELTHAVFAWATLHEVVDLRATWRQGGHMRFRGEGNWLIAIAPYFFPTAAVVVVLCLFWVPATWLRWTNIVLGASVAYHMTSTWVETHRDQPDLHRTGFGFAWMFLPTANILSYGLLVAFAAGGTDGTGAFLADSLRRTLRVLNEFVA